MVRASFIILSLCSMLFLTACSNQTVQSTPVSSGEKTALLGKILLDCTDINELYYEEVPVISHYSGGIKIENSSRVWFKANTLKTEQITKFYQDNELLDSEINGELYDYNTLQSTRYYLGQYPEQAKSYLASKQTGFIIPRERTILWYLDKVSPEPSSIAEGEYEGEPCLIVEILKNNLGSTRVWVCSSKGLPVKVENNYNGNISQRHYCNFKVGEGAVRDEDLQIPPGALTL